MSATMSHTSPHTSRHTATTEPAVATGPVVPADPAATLERAHLRRLTAWSNAVGLRGGCRLDGDDVAHVKRLEGAAFALRDARRRLAGTPEDPRGAVRAALAAWEERPRLAGGTGWPAYVEGGRAALAELLDELPDDTPELTPAAPPAELPAEAVRW